MKSEYVLGVAHSIRIATGNKYDIVDVLEMHPYRRRLLLASVLLEQEERPKPKG
jgi:hypothetical protein